MEIRQASAQEMLQLWNYDGRRPLSNNARFFCNCIQRGDAAFWTIDEGGELIGELYVFYRLEDRDFADGERRAYLCAFRVRKDWRGQGLGERLLTAVLGHVRSVGYREVTIGVELSEPRTMAFYRRMGFETVVKDSGLDPCDRDEKMQPKCCPGFRLLCKYLS